MDDLREAAAMMAEPETKARLAELHTKRRRLDLSNQGRLEMETFFFSVYRYTGTCIFKNVIKKKIKLEFKIKQILINI